MAPSFDNLTEDNGTLDSEEEIDFSGLSYIASASGARMLTIFLPDLKEQHEVRLEQGLDAFVVVDGLPIIPEESKPKLIKFLIKQLNKAGRVKEDGFFMPVNEKNMTQGYGCRLNHVQPELIATATRSLSTTPHSKLPQQQSSCTERR